MFKYLQCGIIFLGLSTCIPLNAQFSKCATMQMRERKLEKYPDLKEQLQRRELETQHWLSTNAPMSRTQKQIIKIPVVFHVIWHDPLENVSDQQIYSQLAVLNEDFRLMNKDSLPAGHPFHKNMGDAGVEFCLAAVDPDGNPTNGITRTYTSVDGWSENDLEGIKSTANGGRDNWSPASYLNLYVVNIDGETLGFSSFPDELAVAPDQDGVVIRYEAFGTLGTAGGKNFETNNRGRTATHEVGHWLNLYHIWGDEMCGDDKVADTPPAEDENMFCPSFPQRPNNACGSNGNGEMYMNYMDYVEDSCMAMFTKGQAGRMLAAINLFRPSLVNSNACAITGSGDLQPFGTGISVSPNPNNGYFICKIGSVLDSRCTVNVFNSMGVLVRQIHSQGEEEIHVDCSELYSGLYYLVLAANSKTYIEKLVLNR